MVKLTSTLTTLQWSFVSGSRGSLVAGIDLVDSQTINGRFTDISDSLQITVRRRAGENQFLSIIQNKLSLVVKHKKNTECVCIEFGEMNGRTRASSMSRVYSAVC